MKHLNRFTIRRTHRVCNMKYRGRSRYLERPNAPHNTTQYLSRNLSFRANALHEEDVSEIKGTMEGKITEADIKRIQKNIEEECNKGDPSVA